MKGIRFSERREIGSVGHEQVELCVVGGMEGLEADEYLEVYLLVNYTSITQMIRLNHLV